MLVATTGIVYAQTYRLYTLGGFVEMLIERGIVTSAVAQKAREIVKLVERVEDAPTPTIPTHLNANKVEVSVSQLIEHANLNYKAGSDIRGLLLLVKNMSTSTIELETKRRCQVVYRIKDGGGTVLYNKDTSEQCSKNERVTYLLKGSDTRMFEVRHRQIDFPLAKGTYTFELEYPGYGGGSRTVIVE